MIRYALHCEKGHAFEAWFASSAAYDAQARRGQVECPDCGSRRVTKAPMAPNIAPRAPGAPAGEKSAPEDAVALLRKMREQVMRTSEDVGDRFAEEALKIHHNEVEPRGIYGSATAQEAKELREEGVEFHPLPVLPEDQN